jgi:hypothetical protein
MTIMRVLVTIILFCFLMLNVRKMPVKSIPCYKKGYTFISADSAVTACGDTIAMKRYRP